MENEWQRLVCCKEMLHILDPVGTCKPDDVEALVGKIILPADLQDPFTDGSHALADRVTITYATAILFPIAARQIFLPLYNDKKIDLVMIARAMEIPVRSAAIVMSDLWPEIHGLMTGAQKTDAQPNRVTTLATDNSTIEVYSVPLGQDGFDYARRLLERGQTRGVVSRILVEANGEKRWLHPQDLSAARTDNK
jgi:hypothetical protein